MRTVTLPLPIFGFVVATRAALGVGIGLILAERLSSQKRRIVGPALIAFGAATTVPAVRWVFRSLHRAEPAAGVELDSRLVGASRFARKGDDPF